MKIKTKITIIFGKIVKKIMKLFGKNGSYFVGVLMEKINKNIYYEKHGNKNKYIIIFITK